MNFDSIIVGLIILVAIAFLYGKMRNSLKPGSGQCSCGSANCPNKKNKSCCH